MFKVMASIQRLVSFLVSANPTSYYVLLSTVQPLSLTRTWCDCMKSCSLFLRTNCEQTLWEQKAFYRN